MAVLIDGAIRTNSYLHGRRTERCVTCDPALFLGIEVKHNAPGTTLLGYLYFTDDDVRHTFKYFRPDWIRQTGQNSCK